MTELVCIVIAFLLFLGLCWLVFMPIVWLGMVSWNTLFDPDIPVNFGTVAAASCLVILMLLATKQIKMRCKID